MARGWESKSVEEQQSERKREAEFQKPRPTADELQRGAQLNSLSLARARVAEQLHRSRNERYTEMLQRELEHIEKEIASLQAA